jgi:hypothetical protein
MRFAETTKPDRKSGGSQGTCCSLHRQQMLGDPFKPSFGLSGIMAFDVPHPARLARATAPDPTWSDPQK